MTDRTSDGSPPAETGRFVSGSILRHVVVMAATGSVGLMAIFVVDLLSLFYVSKLGDPNLTAAVGFAAIVQFFATAVNIGLMIAAGALVGKAVGASDPAAARRLAASALVLGSLVAVVIAVLIALLADPLLALIGARGETSAGGGAVPAHHPAVEPPARRRHAVHRPAPGRRRGAAGDAGHRWRAPWSRPSSIRF